MDSKESPLRFHGDSKGFPCMPCNVLQYPTMPCDALQPCEPLIPYDTLLLQERDAIIVHSDRRRLTSECVVVFHDFKALTDFEVLKQPLQ